MRVLHVVEVSHGGVVSYARDVMKEQVRRGYEVHSLAPEGVFELDDVRSHSWTVRRSRPDGFPAAIRRLRTLVDLVRPDVVHLHSFFPGLLGRLSPRRFAGDPTVVFQPHSWAFHTTSNPLLGKAIAGWERIAAHRSHAVACLSTGELQEGRNERISAYPELIGSAVDLDYFHPVEEVDRATWRDKLGISMPRMIVCVGRICRQKGQDQLLEAWSRAPVPNTELVLVGPGDADSLLAGLDPDVRETVRAVGSQDDVRPWFWASDFAVLSSRYEGSSIVVGEAIACGRAVLMTEVAGAYDVLGTADGPGCVVPQDSIDVLLTECRRRFDEPETLSRETKLARDRAVEMFSLKTLGGRVEHLYTEAGRGTR